MFATLLLPFAELGSELRSHHRLAARGREIESFVREYRAAHGMNPSRSEIPSNLFESELHYKRTDAGFLIWFPSYNMTGDAWYLDECGGEWNRSEFWLEDE